MPKIMADSLGVSPIVVMFSVFAGGEMFGLPGLLLAIPVAALLKTAWSFYRGATWRDEPADPLDTGGLARAVVLETTSSRVR